MKSDVKLLDKSDFEVTSNNLMIILLNNVKVVINYGINRTQVSPPRDLWKPCETSPGVSILKVMFSITSFACV